MSIDLSKLPAPAVVEALTYEAIRAAMLADLAARDPNLAGLLPSDPAYKVIEVVAYRELLLRQRVNDAARATMLATATDEDLDHLVALLGVERLVLDPGNPNAVPPVAPTYESDTELRRRALIAPGSYSTAGPEDGYIYHALSADGQVKDATVASPAPTEVVVTVLARDGDGTPDQTLLDTVAAALNTKTVRPLTDQVTVQAASILNFALSATLYLYDGPDPVTIKAAAEASAQDYVDTQHMLGRGVTLTGLHAALHVEGVRKVALTSPAVDVDATAEQAAYCTGITVTTG